MKFFSITQCKYEAAKAQFINLSQRYGYFDANYNKSLVEVSKKKNQASIHLWFDSGLRYKFGELIFDLDTPAQKLIESLVNFKPGDAFDTQTLNIFNQDLNDTGYFKSITIYLIYKTQTKTSAKFHFI